MPHFGLICPELSGHLNPMTTLGRELQRRGHPVTVLARPDAKAKAESAGLGYAAIGEREFPVGAMRAMSAELGTLGGIRAMRFTVEMLRKAAAVILRDAPDAIGRERIDALLVDQVTPAGNTVAEQCGLPWVNVCNALAMNPERSIPPGVLPWAYDPSWFGRLRNRAGNALLHWLAQPVLAEINRHRIAHGLRAIAHGLTDLPSLAQIAQQPACFDFPRTALPGNFHYTGPWHDARSGDLIPFPWEQLDGRPLIYASMGTLQNRQTIIFESIAAACSALPVQLVISLGSRDQDAAALAHRFPGNPVVVPFAPQLPLLERATLAITHAGLNTALESLSQGLPMVAIPITNDQPGVASRLAWLGVAEVLQPGRLTVPRLRTALQKVFGNPRYREKAQALREKIRALDGLTRAADLVERTLCS